MSKLVNLNICIYNSNKNINLNSFLNKNIYYVIELKSIDIILVSFSFDITLEEINKFFNNLNCTLRTSGYKNVYNFLNTYKNKEFKKEDVTILWSNQFLVSPLLDHFCFGLISDIPSDWKSFSFFDDHKIELKINNIIFEKINNWLKIKKINNLDVLYDEKVKELIN